MLIFCHENCCMCWVNLPGHFKDYPALTYGKKRLSFESLCKNSLWLKQKIKSRPILKLLLNLAFCLILFYFCFKNETVNLSLVHCNHQASLEKSPPSPLSLLFSLNFDFSWRWKCGSQRGNHGNVWCQNWHWRYADSMWLQEWEDGKLGMLGKIEKEIKQKRRKRRELRKGINLWEQGPPITSSANRRGADA